MLKSMKSSAMRFAVLGAAASLLAFGALSGTAEAKHKKHFGVVLQFGIPYDGGYVGYRSGRPCRWLKRRAIKTGKSYWWKRYHRCIYG